VKTSPGLALAALLVAAGVARAQGPEAATVTLDTPGVTLGFGLLRTGTGGSGETLEHAAWDAAGGATVTRVIWDPTSGTYFGYDMDVAREGTGFRLEFHPLDHASVLALSRRATGRGERGVSGADGAAPRPLATTPRFPPPQTLGDGDVLTLELLANPTTAERIFDVLKVSTRPLSRSAVEAAVARARTGQLALLRAAALVARGHYWAAAEKYREALEILPRDAAAHNKLGICYQQLDNPVMARRSYERALELDPGYAEVWNNIGTLEQSAKDLQAAAAAYRKAIRLRPDLATPWKNLGNAYLALERPEEAFEAYQEAFRLDPTIVETQGLAIPAVGVDAAMQRFYIAKLLAANGHVDAALEFLVRAREAGFTDFERVRKDPSFESVVADARFAVLFGE
jgi:hypothetical protein